MAFVLLLPVQLHLAAAKSPSTRNKRTRVRRPPAARAYRRLAVSSSSSQVVEDAQHILAHEQVVVVKGRLNVHIPAASSSRRRRRKTKTRRRRDWALGRSAPFTRRVYLYRFHYLGSYSDSFLSFVCFYIVSKRVSFLYLGLQRPAAPAAH